MIQADSQETKYQTRFTNRNHIATADSGPDKGGQYKGFRPHELLEAALATCMNMTLRMVADERAIPLESARVTVILNRRKSDEPTYEYQIELDGPLTDTQKKLLMIAVDRCPVRDMLSKPSAFKQRDKKAE